MQKLSSEILFDYVPKFSRDVHAASDIEEIKDSALTLMKQLASLLFKGQKLVLNDPLEQPQDFDDTSKSNSQLSFMQTILEEA